MWPKRPHAQSFSSWYSWFSSSSWPGLPLSADLVPQDKVSNEPQREEEDGEDDEVQVEFGVQHVELFQDGFRLLEVTRVVFITVKILSIQTIDRQDDTFKTISAA